MKIGHVLGLRTVPACGGFVGEPRVPLEEGELPSGPGLLVDRGPLMGELGMEAGITLGKARAAEDGEVGVAEQLAELGGWVLGQSGGRDGRRNLGDILG